MTAWPLGGLRRNSSLSARMRSVVRFMVSIDQEIGVGEELGPERTARAVVTMVRR
jgi:hypothetical protein